MAGMDLMRLKAILGLDSSEYEKGVKQADNSGKQLASKLEGYFKKIAAILSVGYIAKKLIDLGKSVARIGFEYNQQIEDLTSNFEVLLGSAEAATNQIAQLKEFAAKTPFGLADLAEATKTLLAFQVPAEKSTELLRQLGDVALGDKQKLSSLALVMGQVASAGRLSGQDLMQFINQGFNPLNYIAQKTGESMEKLRDRMSKGKVSYAEVAEAVKTATSEGGQFYQGMEKASQTFTGLQSTLQDNWAAFWGRFMEPVNEAMTTSILPALIDALGKISGALFDSDGGIKFYDESGNEIEDPAGNISAWVDSVIAAWTDGLKEDQPLIDDFVEQFNTNTESIATALESRYNLTQDEKYSQAAQRLREMQTEIAELLQAEQNKKLTPEMDARLKELRKQIALAQQMATGQLVFWDTTAQAFYTPAQRIQGLLSGLAETWTSTKAADDTAISDALSALDEYSTAISGKIDAVIASGELTPGQEERLETAKTRLTELMAEYNSILSDGKVDENEKTRLGQIATDIEAIEQALNGITDTNTNPFNQFVTKLGELSADAISAFADTIVNWVNNGGLSSIERFFSEDGPAGKVLAFFKNLTTMESGEILSAIGAGLGSALSAGIDIGAAYFQSKFDEKFSAIRDKVEESLLKPLFDGLDAFLEGIHVGAIFNYKTTKEIEAERAREESKANTEAAIARDAQTNSNRSWEMVPYYMEDGTVLPVASPKIWKSQFGETVGDGILNAIQYALPYVVEDELSGFAQRRQNNANFGDLFSIFSPDSPYAPIDYSNGDAWFKEFEGKTNWDAIGDEISEGLRDDLKTQVDLVSAQIEALSEALQTRPIQVEVFVNADKLSSATAKSDSSARNTLNKRTALGVGQ